MRMGDDIEALRLIEKAAHHGQFKGGLALVFASFSEHANEFEHFVPKRTAWDAREQPCQLQTFAGAEKCVQSASAGIIYLLCGALFQALEEMGHWHRKGASRFEEL